MLGERLLLKLRDRFGAGGLVHYGQGKWYPGEPLPRWALGLWWRRDGRPIWRGDHPALDLEPKATADDAAGLIRRLAARLGVDPALVIEAREDPLYWIKAESDLPDNITVDDLTLDDPKGRATLVKAIGGGLAKAVGYVLPLRRADSGKAWISEAWSFRRAGLYLVPGDSPVGLRLPFDSLPVLAPEDYPHIVPPDPSEERGELGDPDTATADAATPMAEPAFVRTALTVEARGGWL